MLQSDLLWYVVMTEPRAEAAAARDLRRKGYKTLFLHTSEWVASGKRKSRLVKRPHLPRYIFIGLGPEKFENGVPMLHDVNNCVGVSSLVTGAGGKPMPVPQDAMELITWDADPTGQIHDGRQKPGFGGKPGDLVRLGDTSPYFGFMAEIMRVDPSGKITILIETFGRKVPTTITENDVDELVPVDGVS
jgi:transcription antitermination factor NusG